LIKNIGIIGLGSIGSRHLRVVKRFRPKLNITAIRLGEGKKVKEQRLIDSTVYSIEEAIRNGIKAAIIASPAVFHVQQAITLMENGIHILIEKPLSHSLINIKKLLNIAKESKLVGLVGYCLRYDPCAIKFNEILKNKNIGKILQAQVECGSYLPDWREGLDYRKSVSAKAELGGGVLSELSHELDYAQWFFGEMKSVISAKIGNSGILDINVEDYADIIFQSKRGFPINIHLDFNSRNTRRKCIARCTNGNLIWDAIQNKVTWQEENEPDVMEIFKKDKDYIYIQQMKHFFDCIENKTPPLVTIDNGVSVLKMIECVKKSNKNRKMSVLA